MRFILLLRILKVSYFCQSPFFPQYGQDISLFVNAIQYLNLYKYEFVGIHMWLDPYKFPLNTLLPQEGQSWKRMKSKDFIETIIHSVKRIGGLISLWEVLRIISKKTRNLSQMCQTFCYYISLQKAIKIPFTGTATKRSITQRLCHLT